MIPIYLDPAIARVALVGRGPLAERRLQWLRDAGATPDVWTDETGTTLHKTNDGWPNAADLAAYHAVWIVGLNSDDSRSFAEAGRDAGVLVNVEDVLPLCDFHTPAVVRRGKLTLTAGTGGASPAVARAARGGLQSAFPESWQTALDEIATARAELRARSASFDELIADARTRLAEHKLI